MNGRVEYGEGASVARTVPGTVTAARKPRLSVRSGVVAERGKNGAEAEIRTPDLLITNYMLAGFILSRDASPRRGRTHEPA